MFTGSNTTSVASGSYVQTTVAPAPAVGRIQEAGEQMLKMVESLAGELQALTQRIEPVLRPELPSGNVAGADVARPKPSGLAAGMEHVNERLYQLLGTVQNLTARVDL
jgi:hypothetical protein